MTDASHRSADLAALDVWIGRWINLGHLVNTDHSVGPTIITSDVYEWAPGRRFVLHTAYGRVGENGGGAIEIIGLGPTAGTYTSHLYDSAGNVSTHSLSRRNDTWTYRGETTRSIVEFDPTAHVQSVVHEQIDRDGSQVTISTVTLTKVD